MLLYVPKYVLPEEVFSIGIKKINDVFSFLAFDLRTLPLIL